jgi:hypothetical protein
LNPEIAARTSDEALGVLERAPERRRQLADALLGDVGQLGLLSVGDHRSLNADRARRQHIAGDAAACRRAPLGSDVQW